MKEPTNQPSDRPTRIRSQTGARFWLTQHFSNYSLRTKLIVAFLVVALIPMGILAFLSNRGTQTALIDAANQALFAGASQTAAKLDAFISTNLDAVNTETLLPGIVEYLHLPPDQRANSDEERLISETLQRLTVKDENILSYALLNTEGQNVMDTVTTGIGQDESSRDYFYEPTRTNQHYVSPIQFDPTTGEAALYFSSPVHPPGQGMIGVLRVRYSAAVLQQLIVQSNGLAGERSFAILLDENHIRLAHGIASNLVFKFIVPPDPAHLAELQANGRVPVQPAAELATDIPALETGLARVDTAEPYFTTQSAATGEEVNSAAVTKMETQPWLVVFARPQEVLLAPVEGQTRIMLLLLAVVIAGLVVAMAIVMAQWLAGPITRLTAVAAEITAGNLTAQAQVESGDEIGTLAATFNSMTTQLRQTMEGLEQRVVDLKQADTEIKQLYEEAQSRSERLAIVNRIARAAGATLHMDDLLEIVYQEIRSTFQADAFSVALYDEETNELDFRLQVGEGACAHPDRHPLSAGLISRLVNEKKTLLIQDLQQEWGTMKIPASWLGVPMQVGERVTGVICVQAYHPHAYGEEEQLLLSTIADQVAVAVENARLFQAEREQRELAKALEEAAAAVSSTLDIEQVLGRILKQVERVVAGDAFNIMLIEKDHARVVRWRGYEPFIAEKFIPTAAFPITEMLDWQQMGEIKESVVIPDVAAYPDWVNAPGMEWLRSYVGAPIQVDGTTVGFLNVDGTQPGQFGPADARRLKAFANHAATAIENARLFGETQQRVAELETLQRTSLQLTSSLDLSAVLDSIAVSTLTLMEASDCHIYLYDDELEAFTFGTALWKDGRREAAVQAPRPNGLTATVARGAQPVVINDARHHPLYTTPEAQKWSMQAIAGFPLKRADRVLGVFTIAFLEPHTFSQEELRVLSLLADQAAIAIENAQLYRQLRDHAGQLEQRVQERTAQLQAQYARLDAILRSATDGIVVTDAEGEIIQTNPVTHTWLTRTLSPEDAARLREAVQDLARRVEEGPEIVLELTGMDLELKVAPISQPRMEEALRRDFGEPSGRADSAELVAGSGQELSQAAESLGRATQNEPAAVVVVHDVSHLKALDRMKSRFVSNVSHELRTPITTIKLYAALMQRNPKKWKEYLGTLTQEADRQAQLVAGILQISHIDTGRLELKPRPTSLNRLTDEIVASYQVLAREGGLTLEHRPAEPGTLASLRSDLPGECSVEQPVVLMDPERMKQVLNNLVGNAIRYTPEGGKVVVSAGKEEAEGRDWATVTVADTGMGIPEEELPHIFERFFRGEKPRMMQISGTGLGLAIAREIVELHGGHMTVESKVDAGTTFTIWLPLTGDSQR